MFIVIKNMQTLGKEKIMKKIILTMTLMLVGLTSFAANNSNEALKFIQSYINAANTYSTTLPTYYSPNAKIIRVVEKTNGGTASVVTGMDEYTKQLKLGAVGAKVTKYKNYYTNLKVTPLANGYKVSGLRQPSGESYRLPVYFIVQKNKNGKWQIVEESMNTKVQKFLKYAK